MLSNANFLILDEPTNHLDISSKEILENAINNYTGTVLYVSHDRYFINTTASRIIELTHHTIINYIGNYDYYIENKDILTEKVLKSVPASSENVPANKIADTNNTTKADWKQSKEEMAKQRKIKNELKRVEERIADIEEQIKDIDEIYNAPETATDTAKLIELHNNKEKLSTELDELYEKWDNLMSDI